MSQDFKALPADRKKCPSCGEPVHRTSGFRREGNFIHLRYICPKCRVEFYVPPLEAN